MMDRQCWNGGWRDVDGVIDIDNVRYSVHVCVDPVRAASMWELWDDVLVDRVVVVDVRPIAGDMQRVVAEITGRLKAAMTIGGVKYLLSGGGSMMDRLGAWRRFSEQMLLHIEQYAIPQYQKEGGDDEVGAWTAKDCMNAIRRYEARFGTGRRGNVEALRDILKTAHYAQLAYDKLKQELGEDDVYSA